MRYTVYPTEALDLIMSRLTTIRLIDKENEMEKSARSVFMNHVILTAIFTHLPTSALKTARLVCQLWESIATPFLGEKSVLVPTKMFPCCKSARIPYVNPKLVRNIRLDNHCRTGECKGDGKDIDQRHDFLCKIKNNAGLSVNPSLQKVFDNLSTRYSEHIEQVRLRLIAEYIPRSKDRTRSVIHLACYNFSELPNICLVTIERPSSIRGQAMEIKFDKRLPVPSELKKLYLYPCAIHLQHTGPFNSSEKLMILSEEEEKLSKPKAVKERRRDNIPRRDEVMETVKVPVLPPVPYNTRKEMKRAVQARPPVRKYRLHQPRRN
ncbi:uncharacterized protein LOC110863560 isoform X2 [Folsomia candida]|uniref:uncharacterized protein LOC110863560 isoform X2 n=1 Tax=Folsomia candida TaxID=158441 RepID=UPI000B908072|nr:uncharacterized protein LOC110863560 isoform X2 [Folsomia candida]